jgi:nucleotide-binding universal stress UspA family protein
MAKAKSFTVLVATDGSAEGTAAVIAATQFPWPAGSRAQGAVVRTVGSVLDLAGPARTEVDRSVAAVAEGARTLLARRWPGAEVRVVNGPTVAAIEARATRIGARAIVLGSRGHGPVARLLLGSTSLGLVRRTRHAALVVRGRPAGFTRVALAFDGSAHARRAATFLAGLEAPAGAQVTIISVLEPLVVPSLGLIPAGARAAIQAQIAKESAAAERKLRQQIEPLAARLGRAGFEVDVVIRRGAPLYELLAAVKSSRAQFLAVGARGKTGAERVLLGSVCEGALHRAPIPVLVVR